MDVTNVTSINVVLYFLPATVAVATGLPDGFSGMYVLRIITVID